MDDVSECQKPVFFKNPCFSKKKPEFFPMDDVRECQKPEFLTRKTRPSFGRGLIISLIDLNLDI